MANTNLETITVGSDVLATFHNVACSTAATTAAKTATAENTFALFPGANVRVAFANANTAANPTLNINSTGAAPIMVDTATAAGDGTWSAGAVLDLRYNGASWLIVSAGAHDAEKANQAQISGVFSASATYAVGDYVVYIGLLYRCTTAHSGAWNAAHFEQVTIGAELNTRTPVYGKGVNLLDNAYFIGGGTSGGFPVNQRGKTGANAYTTYGGTIDRWSSYGGTVGVLSGGITLSGFNNGGQLYQNIENYAAYKGKDLTLSALGSSSGGNSYHISIYDGISYAIGDMMYLPASKGLASVTFTVSPNATTLVIQIINWTSDDATASLEAVKLELGRRQTLAHLENGAWVLNDPPPNYQQELAKCQRYLWIPDPNSIYFAPCFIDGAYKGNVEFPVTMARTPVSVTATSSTGVLNVGSFRDGIIFDVGANVGYITNVKVSAE